MAAAIHCFEAVEDTDDHRPSACAPTGSDAQEQDRRLDEAGERDLEAFRMTSALNAVAGHDRADAAPRGLRMKALIGGRFRVADEGQDDPAHRAKDQTPTSTVGVPRGEGVALAARTLQVAECAHARDRCGRQRTASSGRPVPQRKRRTWSRKKEPFPMIAAAMQGEAGV